MIKVGRTAFIIKFGRNFSKTRKNTKSWRLQFFFGLHKSNQCSNVGPFQASVSNFTRIVAVMLVVCINFKYGTVTIFAVVVNQAWMEFLIA